MESALTVFDQSVNLVVLAQSTKAALDLLAPWYQSKHSSKTLILISRQAELYVHAVNSSILASQRGFTIADEAINLFEVLQSNNIEGSKDMEIQKQEYLNTMFELAVRGHELTKEALNKFRNVRQTVLRLIQEAKNEDHGSEDPTSIIKLSNLENSISILEDFSENMSQYASWWNRMEMMQSAQKTSTEMFMKYANNALRQQTVVQKWMKLREEYVQYTEKVGMVLACLIPNICDS
ncbi:hypothetical protein B0H34DRAFT_66480 [Crassisporium funariophilum]|nr:hypothetical protein B0H34DRAFT_66480 [Crassisporium funariophilum]